MPKPRKPENRGLPTRWQHTHGAYYYRVPPGLEHLWDGFKRFPLGKTLPDAYKAYAERVEVSDKCNNIAALLDRYAMEVVPTKAVTTRESNVFALKRLRVVFGAMLLSAIKPRHVYQYVDLRSKKVKDADGRTTGGKITAHREVEVLSHAFTKAVQWGYIDRHPFKGEVRLEGEKARTRYVEDWEIVECLKLKPKRKRGSVLACQAYIRNKLLSGMARGDLLRLRLDEHIRADGIHVTRHKTAKSTGKRTVYTFEQVPERLDAIEEAKRVRPALSPFLFCNRRGEGYFNEKTGKANGFDSMWGRFMDRVLAETAVKERFTEHDLRAKVGSDAASLERARALLQHADAKTTAMVYRRKPERV